MEVVVKRIILVALVFGLWSCSTHEEKVADGAHAEHQHEAAAATELTLNNGEKWKADAVTKANVDSLLAVLDSFKATTASSLEQYHAVAAELQQVLDKLISDCTMEGPDHDALHLWLHPLLERVDLLKSTKSVEDARHAFHNIDAQVRLFTTHFA